MPDISLCMNVTCPSRGTCYRYLALPTPGRQSYMSFTVPEGEDKCDSYKEIWRPGDHVRLLEATDELNNEIIAIRREDAAQAAD